MRTCIVVDDSSVVRKVARRILEQFDFTVSEAEDGAQALQLCQGKLPDAVLLDASMPVMDGYEFLRGLRRMPGGDRPKVIMCQIDNDDAQIARAHHVGANEILLKPFDRSRVAAKLSAVGLG
jgi:two-component system, chemotaxis family, chemotaxis protein CheY